MPLTTLQQWEYLASYGDLINAFGPDVVKAYNHYNTFVVGGTPGGAEIRPITFDAWGYLASYDDLISAFHSDVVAAARHYVAYGYGEHRDTKTFDAQAYLDNYSDLSSAFGTNLVKAEEHYVTFGRAEGRNDYTLTAVSASSLDAAGHVGEGHTVLFTLDTHDLAQGTTFSYSLSGITLSDLADGSLSGTAVVGSEGKAIISVNLASDHTTEGAETLTLSINDHVKSVIVDDASPLDPVGTFTLTEETDIESANIFIAPQVYTPGGNDRINSLQDEDQLTGTGADARLDLTLGDYNDNGQAIITPVLNNIKTVNIAVTDTGGNGMTLDLQDSDSALTNVNITRISTSDSDVINMHKEAANLSVSNAQDVANLTFTYIDDELVGASDAVSLTLSKVNADDLILGSQSVNFNQIETVNLTIAAGGASTVNLTNLRPDNLPETSQRLNITANAALVLGEDVDLDHGTRPAAPAVAAAACYGTPAYAGLAGHDLGFIEHNNAFTDATTASLNYISITGAGNVTLDSVGSAPAFVLNGSTSTGNIAVNISNAADDATARFTTGDGNDTVLVDSYISGYESNPVSGGSAIPVYAHPDFAAGVNEISGNGVGVDSDIVYGLVTGKGDDVVISYNDVAITGAISTGDGNDFVSVAELLGSVGAPIIKDFAGATVNLGDGNNWVNALNLGEEARIISGSGNDVVNLTTVLYDGSGKTVIHADSSTLDADTNSAIVDTGAGNDLVNFTFTGAALNDLVSFGADNYTFTPGYSVIEGLVKGGEGTDEIRVTGNKDLDLVLGNSADDPRVTGVEVLTLNSTTAYDLAFKTAFEANNGYRTISVNDNNAETADYRVNVNEFDVNLQTINLNHCDGVIRNTYPEYPGYKAFAGDDATDTLFNLRGTETIHVRALETDLFDPHFYNEKLGLATSVSAANDELGTVYSAGASATSWAAAFNSDLTVNLRLQTNSIAPDVAHVVLEDVATLSDPANSPLDPLDVNYDVTIDDITNNGQQTQPGGSFGSDTYEALDLTVNGADNHGVDLKNDFDDTLTVTGTDTKGGNLTIINVDAASINTTGYQGNVYLGVESTYNHTIITGIGNDIIRLGDQTAIALGKDSVDAGEGNDIVVFNGTGTSSVNHAGLDNHDTVKGGAGNDILAFGGQTSYTPAGYEIGVTLGASEWQNVSGFETIQLSAGQVTPDSYYNDVYVGSDPHGTTMWDGSEVWVESGDYYLNITNDLIDANGGNVLHIVNNNVDDSGVKNGVNNGSVMLSPDPVNGNPALVQLGAVSEGNTTLNLLGLNTSNQITYDGAIGNGGYYGPTDNDPLVVDHGSNDRFIFTDVNLEGLDTIDGGAPDSDGVGTWCGNADVLEIRHLSIDGDAPEVVGADLANITNVGTIVFNNDTVGEQTLIIGGFTDELVDGLVDSLHAATATQSETLYIVAQDGSLPYSSIGYGSAVLNLDASALTEKSNLDITLDTHLDVLVNTYDWILNSGGSGLFSSYFLPDETGYDIIVTGAGDDTIHGVTSGDQVDAMGGVDTVDFTTDFADWDGDNQLQHIEHYITANNSNIILQSQLENLDIIIGNGGGTNNNQIIGGSGTDTLTFTDNYVDDADGFNVSALNNHLIDRIENLVVDGRQYGVAVDGAVDGEGNVCTTIGAAGVDGVTHFPHELITILDRTITVNISDQTEAFNITLTDNVSGGGDVLFSGQGADTITGGTGNDSITGGLGADGITITSGGADIVYLTTNTSSDTITGFSSNDVLDMSGIHNLTLSYSEVNNLGDVTPLANDANVIVFGNVPGGINAAASAVANDGTITGTFGFIVITDGTSSYVYESTDLGNDGTETLVATLVGIPNPQNLDAVNFAV